ncbi:MAG: beta-N-acetylhexosaminidase [Pirellulaceae bacterium]
MNLKTASFKFAVAIALYLSAPCEWARASDFAVVPNPVRLTPATDGLSFAFSENTVLTAGHSTERETQQMASWLRVATGCPLLIVGEAERDCVALELDPSLEDQLGTEGYRLSVTPSRILIRAAAEAGLFYGGITLRQLLPTSAFGAQPGAPRAAPLVVPCVEIEDSPRFVWRGLLLDVARHYMPVEFIKKFIDLAALHKFNRLQLHLTDDQGWRMEINRYPRLTEIGSVRAESPARDDRARGDGTPYGPFFYTQQQLRDLVDYAQARHVTLVPEVEMPGHFLAALAAYPQYSCSGGPFQVRTRWGVEPDVLCPGNDEAVEFALNVLAEVTDVFPSRFIHIGGDEAPRDRWKTCPKCQARMRAEGFATEAQLQTYLNHRVEEFLTSRGRRLIGWDEILEGGLTPGAVVMSWRGTEGGIAAATAGHDVVMSPTSHCYFDYAQGRGPTEPVAIGGFLPLETVYGFEPLPAALPEARRQHILGVQGNLWTEYIPTPAEAEYFAFPRAVALAEVAWSPAALRNLADFQRRMQVHMQRLDRLAVNYRPLSAPAETPPGRTPPFDTQEVDRR